METSSSSSSSSSGSSSSSNSSTSSSSSSSSSSRHSPYQLHLLLAMLRQHPFCSVFTALSSCTIIIRSLKIDLSTLQTQALDFGLASGQGWGGWGG